MGKIKEDDFIPDFLCHKKNLIQKAKNATKPTEKELLAYADRAYQSFVKALDYDAICKFDFDKSVEALEHYISEAKKIEKAHRMFNWRSDFAGSIIPEFLYRIAHVATVNAGLKPVFTTRNTIIEITGAAHQQGLQIRRKNEDFGMGFNEVVITIGGEDHKLVSLVVVCEVKTNIDINKLNGLDFSAEHMKRTFPGSAYILVTETIDYSLSDNYASSYIDEVYVLRKQVRSAARRKKQALCPEVFASLLDDILNIALKASNERGHVYDRLAEGRLIHV